MILQGSQRGGSRDLARHLMKAENEHVEVYELRGFASNDLRSALDEAHAVSKGTRAKQFLFSLSLNPPPSENVDTDQFISAIDKCENRLGLMGQPRAIVFHEKNDRRHCHVVWSRIDAQALKAIPLPHTRLKLQDLSRDLYLEHGWKMPQGFSNSKGRDPLNFTMAEWQQAKRAGKNPRAIKTAFQDAWAVSDTGDAFGVALKERGYVLSKGDRRGFVAIDLTCEVYAVPKWTGLKTKDVQARLKDTKNLPSVHEAKAEIAAEMQKELQAIQAKQAGALNERYAEISRKRQELVVAQTEARKKLRDAQYKRSNEEALLRQRRLRKGIAGLWDRITGARARVIHQNEIQALLSFKRDQRERDLQAFSQIEQRRVLQKRMDRLSEFTRNQNRSLQEDLRQYREIEARKREKFELSRKNQGRHRDVDPSHEI